MTNLNLIRRFYCTPVGNYYFLCKKSKIDNNRKNKIHIPKNKKKLLISSNNSYKFLYNFNKYNSKNSL